MRYRRRDKFITFGVFILGATGLILLSLFLPSDFYLVSLTFLIVGLITIVSGLLDKDVRESTRLVILILGLLYFVFSMIGLLFTETNLSVPLYCIFLGSLDIVKGLGEIVEVVNKFKRKNMMAIAFLIDGLIDLVLGILMVIEKDSTLRLHVNLIAGDCYFECIIRIIDEAIAEKKRLRNG